MTELSEPGEFVTCPWPAAPVAPPVMTPCPAGWREVPATDPDGAPTCDPWPDGGRHTCADDEAHFPGEPARSRVGSPCPTGDWADDLPASDVVFVRAGAPSGGDGTRGSPFSTIAEATAAADPGTTIALGKGSYDESVRLGPGCTLWGACVALTVVDRSVASDSDAAIEVTGADTMVRNLLVTGQSPGLVAAGAATSLEIEDVIVAGASVRGVRVTGGATVTAHDLVVRDTAGSALDGTRGRGVQVEEGATVTLRRAAVERNRHIGVFVTDAGSTLTMTDVVVAETREQTSDGEHGVGLHVQSGGQVDATRIALERNLAAGAMAGSAGTMLRLTDAVVRDTLGDTHGRFGMGLGVGQGATAEVERVLLQANRTAALLAADAGTVLTVLDVVARGPVSEAPSGDFGRGVDVTAGARAELERVELTAHRGAAVFADGSSTSLVLADLVARDTQTRTSDGGGGTGLLAQHAAQVDVTRVVASRNHETGMVATGIGTILTLVDSVVRDTQSRDDGQLGHGLEAAGGAEVLAERVLLERNREVGCWRAAQTRPSLLRDAVIRDTGPPESGDEHGAGFTRSSEVVHGEGPPPRNSNAARTRCTWNRHHPRRRAGARYPGDEHGGTGAA